jgi:hypothetical protein
MAAITYAQLAFGSIKPEQVPTELKGTYGYQAARIARMLSSSFLETTTGFKNLAKIGDSIGKGLKFAGKTVSPPVAAVFSACRSTKELLTARESYTKLKGVLNPVRQWSVWSNNTQISLPGQILAKGAEISNWAMSVCDTYTWLAKIGMVAQRAVVEKFFNIASTIYLAQSYQVEGAKWWTGHVVNPLNGKSIEFSNAQKVRSVFNLTVTTAYALVTAMSVAQMVGYVIPAASFYVFVSLSVAAVGTVAGHFWEELAIKQ